MPTITAKLKSQIDNSYKIFIEKGLAQKLPAHLEKMKLGDKYAIISDSKTAQILGKSWVKFLQKNGVDCELITFEGGEHNKNLQTVEELAEKMMGKGFNRKSAIIALGGGVTGDIAGFLASIYQRGIPYIQVPTTLLAMVDSSIGGKTGVDLAAGKNLIGTITQPKAVFIDTNFLKTLPETQIRSGLGEIIKYGVIKDAKFFTFLEKNLKKIFALDEKTINHIIERSVAIKVAVVENDQHEAKTKVACRVMYAAKNRMILNYGHTYGHALEKLSNYTLLHGYAISIGMVIANEMAIKKGLLSQKDADRIKALFVTVGLPIFSLKKPTIQDLLSDKKSDGKSINFILPTKIGQAIIYNQKI